MADVELVRDKPRCDPRIGDEDLPAPEAASTNKPVMPKIDVGPPSRQLSSKSSSDETDEKQKHAPGGGKASAPSIFVLPPSMHWIPANFNWSKLKPVIRSAVTAWISLLFVIINPTLRVVGQVSALFLLRGTGRAPQFARERVGMYWIARATRLRYLAFPACPCIPISCPLLTKLC
jgi:hypothetical protein